jgi:hypothetical protein
MDNFDFDTWVDLAKTMPEEFERCRQLAIADFIRDAGSDPSLRALQCDIDFERIRALTLPAYYSNLTCMLERSVSELESALRNLTDSGNIK